MLQNGQLVIEGVVRMMLVTRFGKTRSQRPGVGTGEEPVPVTANWRGASAFLHMNR
jgi:hypothetical protein